MKTFIIIVTYNAMKWIDRCLTSIDFNKHKVVVIDNNSKDGTLKYLEENHDHVILFKEHKNLGFGQANNKGISYALQQGAEHIFLLNQDAYIVNNSLRDLVEFQNKTPSYGILSPVHVNADMTRLDANFSNYVAYQQNAAFYSDHVIGNPLKEVYDVPFVNAAAWLISRECLLTVGGFDPIFFHYGEDDHYCQRVLFHGFKIGIVPEIFIIHDRENRIGPTLETVQLYSEDYFRIRERNLKIRYANPNMTDWEKAYSKDLRAIKRQQLKYLLKGQLHFAKNIQKEFNLFRNKKTEIINSRCKTNRKAPTYLEI